MNPLIALSLLIASLVIARADAELDKFQLEFPQRDHLTAAQLYQMGGSANAIGKIIGQSVLLDVVVTIEREVPLVEIELPKELAGDPKHSPSVISASLISATTEASSLKKGARYRIEGLIVNEGYGAYAIYLHQARPLK